jgi:hypothetical protein
MTNLPSDLTNAVAIAAGNSLGFAVRSDGTVTEWGDYIPTRTVPGVSDAVTIASANSGLIVALRTNGNVVEWMAGTGPATPVSGVSNAVAIAAGAKGYALNADGTVSTWDAGLPAAPMAGLNNVIEIAATDPDYFALKTDGTVIQGGLFTNPAPFGLTNIIAISAFGRDSHAVILRPDGSVQEWGSYLNIHTPSDATNMVAIAAGDDYTAALRADGTVEAWGNNDAGQLTIPLDLPVVRAIAAGRHCTLFLIDPSQAASPPTILGPKFPYSQSVPVGGTARFIIHAVGAPPLFFQWYHGTNLVVGATNATLVLQDVHTGDSGTYTVTVSNGAGPATSQPATLNVLPGLDIKMVPAISLFGEVGTNYRLDYLNAIGPTNNWMTLATVTLTNNPQLYFDVSAIGQPQRIYRLTQVP